MDSLQRTLEAIGQRAEDWRKHPSALTRDRLLGALRDGYDAVLSLDILPTNSTAAPPVTAPTPAVAAEAKHPSEPVAEAVSAPTDGTSIAAEDSEPIAPEPAPEPPVPLLMEEEEAVEEHVFAAQEPMAASATAAAPSSAAAAPATKPAAPKAEAPDDSAILAGKLNKPISDLRSGIPLNEKFGIIRTLFSGNATDFGDAVLRLNNCASAQEMADLFHQMAERGQWDDEADSYRIFLSYVERRAMTLG